MTLVETTLEHAYAMPASSESNSSLPCYPWRQEASSQWSIFWGECCEVMGPIFVWSSARMRPPFMDNILLSAFSTDPQLEPEDESGQEGSCDDIISPRIKSYVNSVVKEEPDYAVATLTLYFQCPDVQARGQSRRFCFTVIAPTLLQLLEKRDSFLQNRLLQSIERVQNGFWSRYQSDKMQKSVAAERTCLDMPLRPLVALLGQDAIDAVQDEALECLQQLCKESVENRVTRPCAIGFASDYILYDNSVSSFALPLSLSTMPYFMDVIYTILCGRPLVVRGRLDQESTVRATVKALTHFLPMAPGKRPFPVVESWWTESQSWPTRFQLLGTSNTLLKNAEETPMDWSLLDLNLECYYGLRFSGSFYSRPVRSSILLLHLVRDFVMTLSFKALIYIYGSATSNGRALSGPPCMQPELASQPKWSLKHRLSWTFRKWRPPEEDSTISHFPVSFDLFCQKEHIVKNDKDVLWHLVLLLSADGMQRLK